MIIAAFRYLLVVLALAAVGFGIYRFVFSEDEPQEDPAGLDATPSLPTEFASPSPSEVLGQGEQVQILNGTEADDKLTQAEEKLVANGYQIAEKGPAANPYEATTVFYQPDSQQVGQTVASLLGATVVRPATENLDPAIPVTVVVGEDYSG